MSPSSSRLPTLPSLTSGPSPSSSLIPGRLFLTLFFFSLPFIPVFYFSSPESSVSLKWTLIYYALTSLAVALIDYFVVLEIWGPRWKGLRQRRVVAFECWSMHYSIAALTGVCLAMDHLKGGGGEEERTKRSGVGISVGMVLVTVGVYLLGAWGEFLRGAEGVRAKKKRRVVLADAVFPFFIFFLFPRDLPPGHPRGSACRAAAVPAASLERRLSASVSWLLAWLSAACRLIVLPSPPSGSLLSPLSTPELVLHDVFMTSSASKACAPGSRRGGAR